MLRSDFIKSACCLTLTGLGILVSISHVSAQPRTFNKYKVLQDRCNGCGNCLYACRQRAMTVQKDKKIVISEERCKGCGDCLRRCRSKAIVPVEAQQPVENGGRKVQAT